MIAHLKLAITLRAQGRLSRTIELCQQQVQLADGSGLSQTVMVGCLLAQWGEVLAEFNDLDGAIERAVKGVELTEGGDLALLGFGNLCLMRVLYARGDLDAVQEIIDKIKDLARQHDLPPYITSPVAAWQAEVWLAQGRLDAVSQWVAERELDIDGKIGFREPEYVAFARFLLAQGQPERAAVLLQRLLEPAEVGERISEAIEILLLQALSRQAGGEPDRAMAALERALTLAEPGGFVRAFVAEGPPMGRLLYEALTRGIAPAYARRLLAAFPVANPEQPDASAKTRESQSALIEPLSGRELEVLELIAQGLTNPEIASRLFLALNTVKAHTRNIYGKLGVNNRTQASARARAQGLLRAP